MTGKGTARERGALSQDPILTSAAAASPTAAPASLTTALAAYAAAAAAPLPAPSPAALPPQPSAAPPEATREPAAMPGAVDQQADPLGHLPSGKTFFFERGQGN